jgi:rubrerythrin
VANEEECEDAKTTFSWAKDTEVKHAEYYKKALAALNSGNEKTLTYVYYVCPKCGNTFEAANVDKTCSFCMTSKDKFFEI